MTAFKQSTSVMEVCRAAARGDYLDDKNKPLSKPKRASLTKWIDIIDKLTKKIATGVTADIVIKEAVALTDYANYLQGFDKDSFQERMEHVNEMAELSRCSIDDFLQTYSLTTAKDDADQLNNPRLTLCTIHAAKGLEWPVVFVPNVSDGEIRIGRADPSEERRIFFVAITRAQSVLYVAPSQNGSLMYEYMNAIQRQNLTTKVPLKISEKDMQEIVTLASARRPARIIDLQAAIDHQRQLQELEEEQQEREIARGDSSVLSSSQSLSASQSMEPSVVVIDDDTIEKLKRENLSKLTVRELKAIVREHKLDVPSVTMKKTALVTAIKTALKNL